MGRSPLILASLAKAALPKVDFVSARTLSNNHAGAFDAALLQSSTDEYFVMRMPRGQRAGLDLETELQALRALTPTVRQGLPFQVPQLVGETKDSNGNRAVLFNYVYGEGIDATNIGGDHPLATSVAGAIAAIHQLPASLVENAGLPSYSPAEALKLWVARMDRAAATGRVPASLLQRWESALEDVNLFRYTPTVVHGDLQTETMLRSGNDVSGILSWGGLRISDPAEDFQWLASSAHPDFVYSVLLAYQNTVGADTNLRQRAALYGELAFANWLVDAAARGNQAEVEDAATVLSNLALELESGESTSVEPTTLSEAIPQEFGATPADSIATDDDFLLFAPDSEEPRVFEGYPLGEAADEAAPTRPLPVIDLEPDDHQKPAKTDGELF